MCKMHYYKKLKQATLVRQTGSTRCVRCITIKNEVHFKTINSKLMFCYFHLHEPQSLNCVKGRELDMHCGRIPLNRKTSFELKPPKDNTEEKGQEGAGEERKRRKQKQWEGQQTDTESAGIASGTPYSLKWVNRKLTWGRTPCFASHTQ